MKKTFAIKNKAEINKLKKAGAKITQQWLCSSTHESYEGRKRRGRDDYLYALKAECDNVDFIYFMKDE